MTKSFERSVDRFYVDSDTTEFDFLCQLEEAEAEEEEPLVRRRGGRE